MEIELTTFTLLKTLLDLKIKKATRQTFKPHEFKKIKRQIARTFTLEKK
jgi:ribosomal protein L29